ncbi:MAG: esterase [Idiomarinaceae bacterium]|uniref:Esterase n=1 Tax=Pseudidiomarina aquimaris TaxID=641841 RepID=A0A432XJG4_9GAMM|nr:YqiA/YcfP family alpha/beta fold hydrolase [Pseudidiomarina aquimaris]MBG24235.1 esterase [Idiomarinaceae bacterium]RUO48766.1 esterase [Pseudidiomarina aquimaris]|tara:strand:+ start:1033 stop:1626 length:594 start_codon:yes stop_codon:yes gene_type:complete
MQPVILFIHGFGSNGFGSKAQIMRDYCAKHDIRFIAPSLSHIPALAWQTLTELVEQLSALLAPQQLCVMGSSLGGFYAHCLAVKYHLKVVLINPSMHAGTSLQRALGEAINYYDNSPYEWRESYVDTLLQLEPTYPSALSDDNCWLLAQTADELLDYREAVIALPHARQTIETGGDHGFVDFARYPAQIIAFFKGTD